MNDLFSLVSVGIFFNLLAIFIFTTLQTLVIKSEFHKIKELIKNKNMEV